jgi:hypothetical protein
LQHQLELLLRAGPDDTAESGPGLTELRILLLALHHGGPATLQVGPMIVSRTRDGLVGGVLTAAEVIQIVSRRSPDSTAGTTDALAGLETGRRIDLTRWTRHSAA